MAVVACATYGYHDVMCEVHGLFTPCLGNAARVAMEGSGGRHVKAGIIPDFMDPNSGTPRLLDVKGTTTCATRYVPSPADGAHADSSGCAVRRRASLVPKECENKAKAADTKCNLSPPGTMGPIERRLREFGPVVPLVFGWCGEVNAEFETLLSEIAEIGASRHWRATYANSPGTAKGTVMWCSPNDNNDNNNNCYFNGNNNFACDGNISHGIGNDYSHNGDYNVYYDGDNNYIPYNNSIPASQQRQQQQLLLQRQQQLRLRRQHSLQQLHSGIGVNGDCILDYDGSKFISTTSLKAKDYVTYGFATTTSQTTRPASTRSRALERWTPWHGESMLHGACISLVRNVCII